MPPRQKRKQPLAPQVIGDTDWEPGPTEYDIVNTDTIQVKYRKYVEEYLADEKNLFKRKFVSISTNVMCAIVGSTKDTLPNYMRDLYMPVELSVTKWSIDMNEKEYSTLHFMFHHREPAQNCRNFTVSHRPNHKIESIDDGPFETPPDKYEDVLSQLYQFLSGDLTLFSMSLKHIRQDVGSVKWLIDQVCGPDEKRRKKYKPLQFLNLLDLYVVAARRVGLGPSVLGKGVADRRLSSTGFEWEQELKCDYHKIEQFDTDNCTSANCIAKARKFSQDIKLFKNIVEESENAESVDDETEADKLAGDFGKLTTNDTPSR